MTACAENWPFLLIKRHWCDQRLRWKPDLSFKIALRYIIRAETHSVNLWNITALMNGSLDFSSTFCVLCSKDDWQPLHLVLLSTWLSKAECLSSRTANLSVACQNCKLSIMTFRFSLKSLLLCQRITSGELNWNHSRERANLSLSLVLKGRQLRTAVTSMVMSLSVVLKEDG